MNSREKELALRKEVLRAHSDLTRLKIRYEAAALRDSLSWRRAGGAVARSPLARDALLLVAAEGLGRHRVARWIAFAARAVAVARLTGLAVALLRKPPADAAPPPPP
jgi:hypothetical protein